jgi:hypothetical protein
MSQRNAIAILRQMFAEGIDMTSRKATNWLRDNLSNVGEIKPESVIKTSGGSVSFTAGKVYLFGYNPKTGQDLKVYDRFPLVLMVKYKEDGFLGLNFHYLHPNDRAIFFNNLQTYVNDEEFDKNPNAIFSLNYGTLKAAGALRYYKPTIKRYYYKNIVSKVTEVPPLYWKFMLFLPLDRFAKMVAEQVWKESRRKI